MPLKKCTSDGKSGWKYGDSGHCYTGKNAKQKAIKQGYSYEPNKVKKELSKGKLFKDAADNLTPNELLELSKDLNLSLVDEVNLLLQKKNE